MFHVKRGAVFPSIYYLFYIEQKANRRYVFPSILNEKPSILYEPKDMYFLLLLYVFPSISNRRIMKYVFPSIFVCISFYLKQKVLYRFPSISKQKILCALPFTLIITHLLSIPLLRDPHYQCDRNFSLLAAALASRLYWE